MPWRRRWTPPSRTSTCPPSLRPATWGTFFGPYTVEGEEVGRVACWAEQGGQAIMWSDDRLAILSVAASPALDAAGLYLWWLDAGPVL